MIAMTYTGPERRISATVQREAWRNIKVATRHGWARVKSAVVTAGFFVYGSVTGTFIYAAVTGAFSARLAADSPIELKPGGVDTILWGVVVFAVGTLVTLVRGWLARRDLNERAMSEAIAVLQRRLDVKDAYELGEEHAKKQLNVNVNVGGQERGKP